MRCVPAAFAIVGLVVLFQPLTGLSAAPLDLDTVAPDEPPEQLCDRLAANPFAGFGPSAMAILASLVEGGANSTAEPQ